jgi:hypothetical protein
VSGKSVSPVEVTVEPPSAVLRKMSSAWKKQRGRESFLDSSAAIKTPGA